MGNEEIDFREVKNIVLRRLPTLGTTLSQLEIVKSDLESAGTDGEKLYYNEDFFKTLSVEEQAFIVAHEAMHVEFQHLERGKGKNKVCWNYATDAVINQMLIKLGFQFVKGGVNEANALNMTSEDYYNVLMSRGKDGKDENNGKKEIQSK